MLDRLVLDALPLGGEIAIFNVDGGDTHGVVTKDLIVVHHVDIQRGTAWEDSFKVEALVKLRVRLILLVLVPKVINPVSHGNYQIRI